MVDEQRDAQVGEVLRTEVDDFDHRDSYADGKIEMKVDKKIKKSKRFLSVIFYCYFVSVNTTAF